MQAGFHEDERWCPACRAYVHYIQSLSQAYCSECGGQVRLFDRVAWRLVLGERYRDAAASEDPDRRPGPDYPRAG